MDGLRSGAAAAALPASDEPVNPFRFPDEDDDEAQICDPLAGLTVLLAVRLADPHLSSTRTQLLDERARPLVHQMVQTVRRVTPVQQK